MKKTKKKKLNSKKKKEKVEVPETKTEPEPASSSSTASSYVPPHLRRQQPSQPSQSSQPSQPSQPVAEKTSSAYVPPSMRRQEAGQTSRKQKVQPNIMDTFEFPTLNSAPAEIPEVKTNGGEKFELPKKSGRVESKTGASSIEIENKFTALSNNN